ncbi:MAG: sel1 repeat family protein [Saprospiraceae bacterium]|nr:sel1 repeat family protein [Saprospiraceae bacterium]
MKRLLWIIWAILFLISCNTYKQKQIESSPNFNENKVYIEKTKQSKSQGKVEFLGRNNEVKIKEENIQNNSSNSRNVLIVSGDNNKIELNSQDVIDNSFNSHDTTIIAGNRNQIRIKQQRIIDNSIASDQNKIILANGHIIDLTESDMLDDSMLSNLNFAIVTDDTLQIEAYEKVERIYKNKTKSGNPKYQFLLAKVYEVQKKCTEAVILLKLSSEQNYVESLDHLADIYNYGLCNINIDKKEALRLYKISAKLGSKYSKEMVSWLDK